MVNEQQEHLDRVTKSVGNEIVKFFQNRISRGRPEFYAHELRTWVYGVMTCAPASPDRVLRNLRQQGRIGYKLVSRRQSLYRATGVSECA